MTNHQRPSEPDARLMARVDAYLGQFPAEDPAPAPPGRASAKRHTRKCTVCRHPHRDAIEADYLNFRSPVAIARDYGIADHSSVYRHVHATGLAAKRKVPLRRVLESIIEQASTVQPTGGEVIRAVYLYTQINDAGEFLRPPGRPPSPYPPRNVVRVEESNRQEGGLESEPNA